MSDRKSLWQLAEEAKDAVQALLDRMSVTIDEFNDKWNRQYDVAVKDNRVDIDDLRRRVAALEAKGTEQ